jgi:hypothetical protein
MRDGCMAFVPGRLVSKSSKQNSVHWGPAPERFFCNGKGATAEVRRFGVGVWRLHKMASGVLVLVRSNRPTHFPRLALQVLHSKMRQPQQNVSHTKLSLLSTALHRCVIVDVKNRLEP